MLDEVYEIEDSEVPPLTDQRAVEMAKEFQKEYESFSIPRQSLETEIWPACDRAMMCIRDDLPYIPTMRFIDNGMLGESDVRDAIKMARNMIIGACIPTDEGWLEPAAMTDEDNDQQLNTVKNLLISKFEGCRVRDVAQVFVDQLLARGTSAIGIKYDRHRQVMKVPRSLGSSLRLITKQAGILDDDGKPLGEKKGPIKYWKTISEGPVIYPIDMYRLFLDPANELGIYTEPSYIYLVFKSMADLKGAIDDKTGEPLYDHEVLKDITEWTYREYYAIAKWACTSTRFMGIDPSMEEMGKFVPVYLFYRQVRDMENGDHYVDKIFYVARSSNRREWRIIRVQDNPNDYGDPPFFVANCDSWMNVPYGTGLAEKSLSALKTKNAIAAIALNAAVLQLFPPMYFVGNVIKDDSKPKMMPGAFQQISMRPGVGLEFVKPYPLNPNNVVIGMQEQKYVSEKILAQTGIQTAGLATDPSKSLSTEKTATEVRQTASEGSMAQQVIVDKLNNQIWEPLAQAMYNLLRQHAVGETTGFVTTNSDGKPQSNKISRDDLDRDRTIKIVGRRGLATKAQEMQNLLEALKVLANPQAAAAIPNLPLIVQDTLMRLLSRLGVPIKPEYTASPEEIFSKEPQVMIAAIKNALQAPKMRAQIAQQLLQSPEGQQFVQQVKQVGVKESAAMEPPEPAAQPNPMQGAA